MVFSRYSSSITSAYDQGFISSYDNSQTGTDQIKSTLSSTSSGANIGFLSNGLNSATSINSSGVNVTGNLNMSSQIISSGDINNW